MRLSLFIFLFFLFTNYSLLKAEENNLPLELYPDIIKNSLVEKIRIPEIFCLQILKQNEKELKKDEFSIFLSDLGNPLINLIEYKIYGNKIFCDASANDELVVDFTYRAQENDWPSYFCVVVEYAMAVVFATSLARDQSMSQLMETQFQKLSAKARSLDGQQQSTNKLVTSRLLTTRLT